MLARLTYSHAAYELSERLVSEVGTYGDAYGRGAFLAEEAATIVSEAMALLEAAVVADRLRGVSWLAVADALELSAEAAEEQFAQRSAGFATRCCSLIAIRRTEASATRRRRTLSKTSIVSESVSTPGSSSTGEAADRIATSRNPSPADWLRWSGPGSIERIGQVLELSEALIKREPPDGVSYKDAELRHAQLKVELYEAMVLERAGNREIELQLIAAQRRLVQLRAVDSPISRPAGDDSSSP